MASAHIVVAAAVVVVVVVVVVVALVVVDLQNNLANNHLALSSQSIVPASLQRTTTSFDELRRTL